jgi:hypothetical protein
MNRAATGPGPGIYLTRGWRCLSAVVACTVVLAGGREAQGWGRIAHRASALLAEERLTPAVQDAVRALLEPGESLADASTWADETRRARPASGPWHYVNVPITEEKYDPRFCPPGGCVVSQIGAFAQVVGDRTAPLERRRVALRYLVHLVQDLHQPVHVGDRGDRGGNDLQLRFFRRGSNLHRVWDAGLIEQVYHDEYALARALEALADGPVAGRWELGTVEDWATESLLAARLAYLRPEDGTPLQPGERLGEAYVESNLPIARLRVAQSGVRLAVVLNTVLGMP